MSFRGRQSAQWSGIKAGSQLLSRMKKVTFPTCWVNTLPFPNSLETLVILCLGYFYPMVTVFDSEIVSYLHVKPYSSKFSLLIVF